MSDNNSSTVKSYVDSATGYVQSALGNLTGNNSNQAEGQGKQERAQAEYDASHDTTKIPGYSASASGGITKDDPDRTSGSWNQTIGAAKEAVGGLVGSESLKQSGRDQNLSGQQQEAQGQAKDFVSGVGDRFQGTVGGAVAGLTGDRAKQQEYQQQHDLGKTQQRGAEYDIQRQADAASNVQRQADSASNDQQ